ncbi:Uncharacterised protein [uncultured Roseburia sp.]|uniref:Uncharacterized protein n=1 Tax=Brotonthovivens ammoniilytica TaxID=2981725 RepID=A0ABT2TJQ4_9FIRM|nr:hypothetical protein [Brotonthovivens ammoniilytica]MCU6762438.1 hypothetical protein [Brotonthovivens ammoniilytica]SCI71720.1 Uncharacterised protein [uncultured Roseburia sp.]
MARKNNSGLFYVCSLIEYIGRLQKLKRSEVVRYMGMETIERIYEYADVFHCEVIDKVASEFVIECEIPQGEFDNVSDCQYKVPDYWTIGEVYERLIEDCYDENEILYGIQEVYTSWIDEDLSDYNTDFYYQPRDYIAACYQEGTIL